MEAPLVPGPDLKTGTAGGVLLVLLLQLDMRQLLETAIIAAVGATVSFVVSLGWKWVVQRMKRK